MLTMHVAEIIRAVDEGLQVYWQSPSYEVIRGSMGSDYLIHSLATGHCIKLLQSDGKTLNGANDDFYIAHPYCST